MPVVAQRATKEKRDLSGPGSVNIGLMSNVQTVSKHVKVSFRPPTLCRGTYILLGSTNQMRWQKTALIP